jgi:hypothetical protein
MTTLAPMVPFTIVNIGSLVDRHCHQWIIIGANGSIVHHWLSVPFRDFEHHSAIKFRQ